MNDDQDDRTRGPDRRRHRCGRGDPRSAGRIWSRGPPTDPGAPFVPEVLERLAALKKDDRAAFEALRAQLKKAGCRVTALDEAIAEENGDTGGRGPTQADILIDLAQAAELFHTPDGTGFADLDINGHRETWPIRAKGFRRWLARRFFEATGGAPSSEALQSALNVIEAKAHFDAPERIVHIRVGGLDGRLYLDLGDETWRAVEIDATGWRVIDNPPVRFRRAAGMQPLPMPVSGGSIETLRSFLNVQSDTDFVLVVAWALAVPAQSRSLSGDRAVGRAGIGEVHLLGDPAGAARSEHRALARPAARGSRPVHRRQQRPCAGLRQRVGPAGVDFRHALPARHRRRLRGAPALHRSGRGAVRRRPAGDPERHRGHRHPARPGRPRRVPDAGADPGGAPPAGGRNCGRRSRPSARASSARCSTRWCEGLKRLPETRLEKLPRMADFALWATACETALWPAGTFWSAYCGNRDEAVEGVIDADPIAAAVRAVMATRTEWTGTASDLLGALGRGRWASASPRPRPGPTSPRALSGRLRRAATFLRKIGIEIGFEREGRARTRTIRITTTQTLPRQKMRGRDRPHRPHRPRARRNPIGSNGFAVARPADGRAATRTVGRTVPSSSCRPSALTR